MTKTQFSIGGRVAVCPDYRNKDGDTDAVFYPTVTIAKDHGMFWELEDGCLFCKSTNLEQGGVRKVYSIDGDVVLENNSLAVENNKMDSRKAAIINLLDAAYCPDMLERILLEVSSIVFE